jgi:hypothetical protein
VFVLYLFASVAAGLGLLLSVRAIASYHGVVLAAFVVLIVFAVKKLRYLEFIVIVRSLFNGDLKRSVARKRCWNACLSRWPRRAHRRNGGGL